MSDYKNLKSVACIRIITFITLIQRSSSSQEIVYNNKKETNGKFNFDA
jgi:hypothetical protein